MDAASTLKEPPAGRDWSELPLDALSLVFTKVGAIDVLMGAGLVCRSWLDASKVPDVWRTVDMENHRVLLQKDNFVMRAMVKAAVDRSDEQLEAFAGKEFVDYDLLKYITERSPSLRNLRLVSCLSFGEKVVSVIVKSPLRQLQSLQLDDIDVSIEDLSIIIENCPRLELLKVRYIYCLSLEEENDMNALAAKCAGSRLTFDWDHDFLRCECDFDDDTDFEFDYSPDFVDERSDQD